MDLPLWFFERIKSKNRSIGPKIETKKLYFIFSSEINAYHWRIKVISFTSEMISYQFTCEWYDLYFHCSKLQLFLTILGLISFQKGCKYGVLVKTLRLERLHVKLKLMTSNSNSWRHLFGLRCATLHSTSSWWQLQAAFLKRRLFFIHSLKWDSKPFSRCKLCLHPLLYSLNTLN